MISDTNVRAVVATMDRQLTYEMLKRATLLIRAPADYIGPNPDPFYPTPEGIVPGGGAILAAISAASDRQPLIIGKPESWMFRICVERMQLGVEEMASLGDRLATDIAGGQRLVMKLSSSSAEFPPPPTCTQVRSSLPGYSLESKSWPARSSSCSEHFG